MCGPIYKVGVAARIDFHVYGNGWKWQMLDLTTTKPEKLGLRRENGWTWTGLELNQELHQGLNQDPAEMKPGKPRKDLTKPGLKGD